MENEEDFYVNYYDGTATSYRIATIVIGTGTYSNNVFYHTVLSISEGDYPFTATARWRLQCDAGDDNDDIYLDQIYVNATILYQWNTVASGYFLFDNTPSWKGTDGYFDFSNSDFTPVYDNLTQGWFSFQNTSSWQGSDGYFTFDNTPTWKGSDGYFSFGNTPSWIGSEGYFTFGNTPTWQGSDGYFTFGNVPSWQGSDGYFTFGNISSWQGTDGYFTFSNGEWQLSEEGWFTFKSVRAWDNLSSGYFTFVNTVSYTNVSQGYFDFSNSPSWHGIDGWFSFGNQASYNNIDTGWFSFLNSVNYQNITQGYFNFSNTPSWHGSEGYFTFSNGAWQPVTDGWFSFLNTVNLNNISQGYFTFGNTPSWKSIRQGYFTFGNSLSWHGTQGYFTFENVSSWKTDKQGWFSFYNNNYTVFTGWYPEQGDIVDPAMFTFMAGVSETNGTSMNITWDYWDGSGWVSFGSNFSSVGNGTYYKLPSPWFDLYNHTYRYRVTVHGSQTVTRDITFTTLSAPSAVGMTDKMFACIILLVIFGTFLPLGYAIQRRSAGIYMTMAGVIFLGLIAFLPFNPITLILMLVFAGYISMAGLKKTFFTKM
jgi:hypothetical protein